MATPSIALERVSDHCSNIAGCVIEMSHDSLDLHEYLGSVKRNNEAYSKAYSLYEQKHLETI